MCGGVGVSGWPRIKETTFLPAASTWRTSCKTRLTAVGRSAETLGETVLTVLASSDPPQVDRADESCGQRQGEDRGIDRTETDLADPDRQIICRRFAECSDVEHGYRKLLLISVAMTAMPAAMLRNARPNMKRPRGSAKRGDIRSGLISNKARAIRNGRISRPQEGIAEGFRQVSGVMAGRHLIRIRLAAASGQAKDPIGALNGRAWLGRHVA